MRKKPVHYTSDEISDKVIEKMKKIAKQRYDEIIYENYFENVKTLYSLCCLHDTSCDEEYLIMGDDWFISYADRRGNIEITEWVAIDNKRHKMAQSKEMFMAIKDILLLSKGKRISAYMRRDSSYQIYLTYLNKGYFQELKNNIILDFCRPPEMKIEFENGKNSSESYEAYFQKRPASKYDKFVLHNVTFELTKNFTDRYKKKA